MSSLRGVGANRVRPGTSIAAATPAAHPPPSTRAWGSPTKRSGSPRTAHLVFAVSTLLPVFGGLVVTPLLTRTLSSADYGAVALAALTMQVSGLLLAWGLGSQIHMTAVEEGFAAARCVAASGAVAAVVLAAFAVGALTTWAHDSVLGGAIPFGIVGGCLAAIGANVLVILRAMVRPGAYLTVSVLMSVCGPALGLGSAWLYGATWNHYLTGLYVGSFVSAALAVVLARGRVTRNRRAVGVSWRAGLPALPHQLALYGLPFSLVAITTAAQDVAAAGELQIGLLVGSICALAVGALNNAWAPVVMTAHAAERRAVADRIAPRMFWAVTFVACLVSLSAPELSRYLAPSVNDRPMIVETAILGSLSAFCTAVYLANSHHVMAARATRTLALTTPLISLASITAAYLSWRGAGWPLASALLLANALIAFSFHVISSRAVGYAINTKSYRTAGLVLVAVGAWAWAAQAEPALVRIGVPTAVIPAFAVIVRRRRAAR